MGTGDFTDSPWSAVSTFNVCPMDINGDGDISVGDRVLLASSWLSEEGDEEYRYYADIDGDGGVTVLDRSYLASNWLAAAGDEDLIYPAPKSLLDDLFAEEFDDLLGGDDFDFWK